jgi:hypothetical protein
LNYSFLTCHVWHHNEILHWYADKPSPPWLSNDNHFGAIVPPASRLTEH